MRDVDWNESALSILGALDLERTSSGLTPSRLPAWSQAQMPDPSLAMIARLPAGVRLAFRSTAERIELEVQETGLRMGEAPRLTVAFDLIIDGRLSARRLVDGGPTIVVDPSRMPFGQRLEPGAPSLVSFADLPAGPKDIEIWLPQTASVELLALRISSGATLERSAASRFRWAHYGSSISHGMEALGPSETWPAVAARLGGLALTSLGFAGQCHVDGLVARALRDLEVDFISLKLGINVVNGDSMRERVFVPTVHSFLDIIRERRPDTPILVVSPIICPLVEDHPGPTLRVGTAIRVFDRPAELANGALGLRRIRQVLARIVERRRTAGDHHLHYLDGLELFDAGDTGDLPDGLHPNAAGLGRIGQRFARRVFAPGGVFPTK
jgi:hypothetical protein